MLVRDGMLTPVWEWKGGYLQSDGTWIQEAYDRTNDVTEYVDGTTWRKYERSSSLYRVSFCDKRARFFPDWEVLDLRDDYV